MKNCLYLFDVYWVDRKQEYPENKILQVIN